MLFVASLLLVGVYSENMNGEYTIGNPNKLSKVQYSTNFSDHNMEYFDMYSPIISTLYSQVFWTMMETQTLPDDLVKRFDGKAMAITGYEIDQVFKNSGW
eukprot:UN29862